MSRRRDPSYLLKPTPPGGRCPSGDTALWWAVIRRAAADARYGHESLALDALEFLKHTAPWLMEKFFETDVLDFQREVATLVGRRHRALGNKLPLEKIR